MKEVHVLEALAVYLETERLSDPFSFLYPTKNTTCVIMFIISSYLVYSYSHCKVALY